MKGIITRRRQSIAAFLLSLLSTFFMTMGGCTEPDIPIGGNSPASKDNASKAVGGWNAYSGSSSGDTMIVWTDMNGTKQQTAAPADGILEKKTLKAHCMEVRSVDFIPPSITSIRDEAFSNCRNLTSITIPSSVTSIGEYAFSGCSNLMSVIVEATMPPTAIYYPSASWGAFENTASTFSITVPDASVDAYKAARGWLEYKDKIYGSRITWTDTKGTKRYADAPRDGVLVSFVLTSNKGEIKSVDEIPVSVTSIGNSAFESCRSLERVTIPSSVISIGYWAFSYCTSLTDVTLPNSVTNIGRSAFENCRGLTRLTIENGVTSIGNSAFSNCRGLTSITIPSSVTSIGVGAFQYCTGLTGVTLPNSVTSIGEYTFSGCSSLTRITIPSSVTSIGERAFLNCSGLTGVTLPNGVKSIGDVAFSSCSGLTSITIPSSVTSIGDAAFYNCSGLTSITIPSSVTSIGESAFSSCRSLTSVRVEATQPPTAVLSPYSSYWNAFSGAASGLVIRVPAASVADYKAAAGWSEYVNQIHSIQ